MKNKASFAGQIDDVNAIYAYMKAQVPKTTEAASVRTQFLQWADNAGWWDKNMSSDWYNEARSRRNAFNLANATTAAQKAQVQKVLATGLTTEQMQGKARPTINVKTGAVGGAKVGKVQLSRLLKLGVSGDDVKAWQSFLGLTPPTGYFDKPTDTKTREYQSLQGLKVDGVVGQHTWDKAFPNASSPALTSDISQAFKKPAAPTFAPATTTSAPKTSTFAPSKTTTPVIAPPTGLAAMMPKIHLPLWAKITGGVAATAAAVGAVIGIKHIKHMHI